MGWICFGAKFFSHFFFRSMTKQRIKREVFLEEDEEILIVKKKQPKSFFRRL